MARNLADFVDAFEQTLRATIALTAGLTAEQWQLPTECPGWTVKDQVAHLVGVEQHLLGNPPPDRAVPDYPHVRNEQGRLMETHVDVRRPITGPEIVAELAATLDRRLEVLRDPGLTAESELVGISGPTPAYRLMALRVFDCWAHEQDIRRVLRRPGNLDSPAAAMAVSRIARAIAARTEAELSPGESVRIEVTGPHPRKVVIGTEPATVTLTMDTEAFTRRGCGRIPVERTPAQIHGDADLGRRVVELLAITP